MIVQQWNIIWSFRYYSSGEIHLPIKLSWDSKKWIGLHVSITNTQLQQLDLTNLVHFFCGLPLPRSKTQFGGAKNEQPDSS